MSAKRFRAPWNKTAEDARGITIGDAEKGTVSEVYNEADARLIAAAPDLLDAAAKLFWFYAPISALAKDEDQRDEFDVCEVEVLRNLEAAIKKGRGES